MGEELKSEPEKRVAMELDAEWAQLEAQWLSALADHERKFGLGVETHRLASLLTSQLELQQLLVQQQRAASERHQRRPQSTSGRQQPQAAPAEAAKVERQACAGSRVPEVKEKQPMILISNSLGSKTLPPTDCAQSGADNPVKDEATCQNDREASLMASNYQLASQKVLTSRPNGPTAAGKHGAKIGPESKGPPGAADLSTGAIGTESEPARDLEDPRLGAKATGSALGCQSRVTMETRANNETSRERKIDCRQSIARADANHVPSQAPASRQANPLSSTASVKPDKVATQWPPTTSGGATETDHQQQPGSGQAREQQVAGAPEVKPCDEPIQASGNQQQTIATTKQSSSELSTQAKIINILFTRDSGPDKQVGGRPLLMPALLRQYQRRLSNFHQRDSDNSTTGGQQQGGSATEAQPASGKGATDNGCVQVAAKAAASLATVAASAAQALIVQQRMASRPPGPIRNCELAPQGDLINMTAHYQRQLVQSGLHPTNGKIESSWSRGIKHFSMNFVDNMNLYELKIIDMPSIEPVAFPTSSLLEWSLFKGRSHLLTADAYLLVFDLTRPSTIQYIKQLRDKIFESREMSNVPVYVIANKADLCATIQPSLQARQMRQLAVRHYQQVAAAGANQVTGNLHRATSIGQWPRNRLTSSRYPTAIPSWMATDAGGSSMAMARQLLSAYRARRVRLGSVGPLGYLLRWDRLRRPFCRASSSGMAVPVSPLDRTNSGHDWFQGENRTHYNLLVGASTGVQDSHRHDQWSIIGTLGRMRRYINSGFRRLSRSSSKASAHGWRRSVEPARAARQRGSGNHAGCGSGSSSRARRDPRKRKKRHNPKRKRRQSQPTCTSSASDNLATPIRRALTLLVGRRVRQEVESRSSSFWPISTRKGKKRKRGDQTSESGGSLSGSIQAEHLGKRGQTGAQVTFESRSQEESEQAGSQSARRVEPVCGAMGTPANRQSFYDLFNRLLQTSSTTAARSQLRFTNVCPAPPKTNPDPAKTPANNATRSSREKGGPTKARRASPTNRAAVVDEGGKQRRRSSGIALWQTLSSYALSRASPASARGTAGLETPRIVERQSEEELESGQNRPDAAGAAQPGPNGVHLGADQYLSVDMLRKLSLISSHSQIAPVSQDTEDSSLNGAKALAERSKSAQPSSETNQNCDIGLAKGEQETSSGGRPSAKRIWYRGMVKKILFHSNKQSLKGLVTAMELQRRADELARQDPSTKEDTSMPEEPAAPKSSRGPLDVPKAPSIRIITSGSSLSILSGQQKQLSSSRSNSSSNLVDSTSNWRDNNIADDRSSAQVGENAAPKPEQNTDEPDRARDEGWPETSGRCEQVSTSSSISGKAKQCQTMASCSLSSLADSVSLSLADELSPPARPSGRRLVQSALAGTGEGGRDSAGSSTVAIQAESQDRLVSELLPSPLGCSLRKLSADDCLIINRQRRKSLAAAAASDLRGGGDRAGLDKDSDWPTVVDRTQSAAGPNRALEGAAGEPSAEDGTADERRQSIKASIEAAIHLLVPRAKGTRSASITLGAADCEQRSRSQLGVSIMGAVNVHRTWRDWRQLLGKRKSAAPVGSTLKQEASGEAGALLDAEAPAGVRPWAWPGCLELNGRTQQQREAAISFDQLMRINQLTLSAANAVMMAQPDAHETNGTVDRTQPEVGTSAAIAYALEQTREEESTAKGPLKHFRRPMSKRRQLMSRLQSGGNLLLKRSSTRIRNSQPGQAEIAADELADKRHPRDLYTGQTFAAMLAREHALSVSAQKSQQFRNQLDALNRRMPPKPTSNRMPLDDSNLSGQIAAAAAAALEHQRDRCERLSAILEPRYDKKQPGAEYPLFASHDLNPILKDLAQLVRKHWHCNYIECSAASNWNIRPIISELTRTLECNNLLVHEDPSAGRLEVESSECSSESSCYDGCSDVSLASELSEAASAEVQPSEEPTSATSWLSTGSDKARSARLPSMLVQPPTEEACRPSPEPAAGLVPSRPRRGGRAEKSSQCRVM